MHISDGELGLAAAMGGRLRADTARAQNIVDRKNAEMSKLLARIAVLERENAALKAERTRGHQQKLKAYLATH